MTRPAPRPRPAHRAAWPLLGALLGAACGGAPAGPAPEPVPRMAVAGDTQASAVAAALVFPGSGWELPGTEGLTLLTARTLLEPARAPLAALGARADVACGRGLFTFTLVAPPSDWTTALDVLLQALFEPEPDEAALDSARARLGPSLSLDQASPAWQARLAARQALHGDSIGGSPWQGPACGVPETLPLFGLPHVRAGAYRFAPRMARIALTGPMAADTAADWLRARLPATSPPPLPAPPRAGPGRRYVERNTITAWTAHGFAFDAGADVEALHVLAALLEHELGPHVSRPDVLDLTYEVEWHGTGGSFILHMVTTPDAAPMYAERLLERVRAVATRGVPAAAWERVARRYRGRRLLERESPEARAAAMARALATGRAPGTGWPEAAAVRAERVRAAAASLGPPARSVVGPRAARGALTP